MCILAMGYEENVTLCSKFGSAGEVCIFAYKRSNYKCRVHCVLLPKSVRIVRRLL